MSGKRAGSGKAASAATPAIAVLRSAGVDHAVHTYDAAGAAFGDEAARVMGERLGVDAARVFKTLVLATARPPAGSRIPLAVAVLPVTKMLDLKAAAAALGCGKVSLAPVDAAEKSTGYVVGGVSPLGQKRSLVTVVDSSASDHQTILCSAGRRGWEIELAPADLVALTGATTAPIAAG
ncbi:aminoacyl-tRNA deacylase [Dietzia sp. PP-33]|jgi:Cys-tRNA(Pro)/Cys-tRNA(Cys) deacylase|uniref:aminoacyl-tRNA deacylase n=1 Tax=Dietzia sp. PP-33 TaxID=2957500 RepID=UPI0029BE9C76|nr:aminoacyl-tRNA deacylase [Dietzia sp. PP-33]MDX2356662.1 aminoacyl-tRNA deacylase [Dietzia sp. PP-33]